MQEHAAGTQRYAVAVRLSLSVDSASLVPLGPWVTQASTRPEPINAGEGDIVSLGVIPFGGECVHFLVL